MPRVNRHVAAKDYEAYGIKKGDTYYRWKFRYGGVRMSKTYPRPSQLTQSEFLSKVYEIREGLDDEGELSESKRDEIVSELQDLQSETDDKFNNLPDGLQQGDTGQLLEERTSWLDNLISELEGMYWEVDGFDWSDLIAKLEEDNSDQADFSECNDQGSLERALFERYLAKYKADAEVLGSDGSYSAEQEEQWRERAVSEAETMLESAMCAIHYDTAMDMLNEQ